VAKLIGIIILKPCLERMVKSMEDPKDKFYDEKITIPLFNKG